MTHASHFGIFLWTRLFPLLFVSVLLPTQLFGCGGSTDTGNPPLVDQERILIERSNDGVRVSGGAGTVPAFAAVEVENATSNDVATAAAGDDGSFEVSVSGTLEDDYRVTVESDGRSESVTVHGGGGSLEGTLLDRSFLLDSADGYTPVEGTTISVNFDDDGFGFRAGCNRHFGEYTLCDGKLCIQVLGSTDIGCDEDRSGQDAWLANFFTGEPAIELDGDELTLTGMEATLVFLDREVANPDRPLTGRTWTVDTIIDGGAASNVPVSSAPRLEFSEDGTLDAFSDCNDIGYSYEVNGPEIAIQVVRVPRNTCVGSDVVIWEHIEEVLSGTVTHEIEAQRLTLMNGSIGIVAKTD